MAKIMLSNDTINAGKEYVLADGKAESKGLIVWVQVSKKKN